MSKPNRVLFGVLNWGLGHATRSVPLIEALLKNNFEVTIASDGLALEYLNQSFPNTPAVTLPSYSVSYGAHAGLSTLSRLPKIHRAIEAEQVALKRLLETDSFDCVISDNRYGCYADELPSFFIGHQFNFKMAFGSTARTLHNRFLKPFDKLLIPDLEHERLSGELASNLPEIPTVFIGNLSRFVNDEAEKDIDILLLLSGPEPQRTIWETKLLKCLPEGLAVTLVRGSKTPNTIPDNIRCIDVAQTDELQTLLNRSKLVVCRSGYSSLMDLAATQANCLLVPTPGQPEQIHLAKYHAKHNQIKIATQNRLTRIDLEQALSSNSVLPEHTSNADLLLAAVSELL